jgi:hypothetical protein
VAVERKQNIRGRFFLAFIQIFSPRFFYFATTMHARVQKISYMAILKLISLSNFYLTTSFSQQLNPGLDSLLQRRYVSYVKRCDELERVRFFAQ